ncbi:MAG: hypothetical protein ABSH41_09325 [Syntrophobacteraceae bacterium]
MNPLSLSILLCLIGVVLFAPRRWAILGMAAGVLYLNESANFGLGLNLFPERFLEIAGFVRVMVRKEFNFSKLNEVDRLLLLFYSYMTIVFLLRSTESQLYQIGVAVDATLCYFIFRGLIRDIDDFRWYLRAFAILLIPYVVLLLVEMRTSQNPFSLLLGGSMGHDFREGRVRCVGTFRHPSLLGTLGASFLPLYIGLAIGKTDRIWGLAGIVLCAAIALLANSGGPISAAAVGLAGWLLWPMRAKMDVVRRCMLGLFILTAWIMKSPVWYLPARISEHLGVGGDAWHRSYLMEVAARDFGKWWFSGMSMAQTADWFPYTLPEALGSGADITNQYLMFGLAGGLLSMILFILLLVKGYKSLGQAMRTVRSSSPKPVETEFLLWGLGVMLSVHIENWLSISYFDQSYVLWFLQLGALVNISQICSQSHYRQREKLPIFSIRHAASVLKLPNGIWKTIRKGAPRPLR